MAGYAKLFSSIVHSTVWREANHVRLVWITMLALADQDGHVEASIPGLSDAARVTLEECLEALSRLSSPDAYSRSHEHEGRRISVIRGGWLILNYMTYRETLALEDRRARAAVRQARVREARKLNASRRVTKRDKSRPGVTERDARDKSRESRYTSADPSPDPERESDARADDPVEPEIPEMLSAAQRPEYRKQEAAFVPPPRSIDVWYGPTPEHEAKAKSIGLVLKEVAEHFRCHYRAEGKLMADWDAAFDIWLNREKSYQKFDRRQSGRLTPPGELAHAEHQAAERNKQLEHERKRQLAEDAQRAQEPRLALGEIQNLVSKIGKTA